jgi:hypothetical protein
LSYFETTESVIYTGNELALFGDDMWAVPVNYLLN